MSLHRSKITVCLLLVVAILSVYWQVLNHEFVNFDDDVYVTKNSHVQRGLTWEGVVWAFTTTHASNWHPMTWLSHMLDCHIFGMNAWGHHLMSVMLHIVSTLILFSTLRIATGAIWRSWFVAALFALHPLHVESVAWIAERKDVLSGLFWMLTMWTYTRYTERLRVRSYCLVLVCFVLGLMSKPMLVTLPFVLLLLDYWPLGRLQIGQWCSSQNSQTGGKRTSFRQECPAGRVILEKIPFFVFSAASCVVVFLAQQKGGAIESLSALPIETRFANAAVCYVRYIRKMIWPDDLAVFYPHPGSALPVWEPVGAIFFLLCISVLVILAARRYRYLPVGWLWFMGTLVPVVGLVQVGLQAMADRYTYLPLIGIFIIISWGIPDILAKWRLAKCVIPALAGMFLLACLILTWVQVRHWRDSVTLFRHTINVTVDNELAHNNLGSALSDRGEYSAAVAHLSEALRIKPHFVMTRYNLGVALMKQEKYHEAVEHLFKAIQIRPDYAEAHCTLGVALGKQGRISEAVEHLSSALRIKPDYAEAHYSLGVAFTDQDDYVDATRHFAKAIQIKPDYAEAYNELGIGLAQQGKLDEAIAHFKDALRIKPDLSKAQSNLRRALRLRQEPNTIRQREP